MMQDNVLMANYVGNFQKDSFLQIQSAIGERADVTSDALAWIRTFERID